MPKRKIEWEPATAMSVRNTCHIFSCNEQVVNWLLKRTSSFILMKPGFFYSDIHDFDLYSICVEAFASNITCSCIISLKHYLPVISDLLHFSRRRWPWMYLWQLYQHLQVCPIDLYVSSLHKWSQTWLYSCLE